MSDHDGNPKGEIDELLDRAADPEPPPAEARERVWSRVSESVGLEAPGPDGDGSGGESGDGDSGGVEPGGGQADGGVGPEAAGGADLGAAVDAASSGAQATGWSGLLSGVNLVQTALAFTVGAGVGAGGYAALDDPEPHEPRQQHVAASPDVGARTDAGPADADDVGARADLGTDAGVDARDDVASARTGAVDEPSETPPDPDPTPTPSPTSDKPSDDPTYEPTEADAPAPDVSDDTTDDAGAEPDISSLEAERLLLRRARSALQRGRHEEALRALRRHAENFADGQLTEERRALEVRALLGLDRHGEARQRAEAFIENYPQSIFRRIVEPALSE